MSLAALSCGLAAGTAQAEPVTTFTNSFTNFFSNSSDGNHLEFDYHPDGSATSSASSLSAFEGYAEGSASADLATGQLKSYSYADGSNSAGLNKTLYAQTNATFGDSFRSYAGDAPFTWSGETASFTFDISGLVQLAGGAENQAGFGLYIFNPGTLDLYAQWTNGADTYDQWSANVLYNFNYVLGPGDTFPDTTGQLLSFPASVTASFTPGSDFDWAIWITTGIFLQGTLLDQYGIADFSHTIGVSYLAPEGVTTYSASGLFPDTVALTDAPAVKVPEPTTLPLLALSLLGAAFAFRRRKGAPTTVADSRRGSRA
jgi:hypothetical protein